MTPLDLLPSELVDALKLMGAQAVCANDAGFSGNTLRRLAKRGLVDIDREGRPVLYTINAAGHAALAALTRPARPIGHEGEIARIQRTVAEHFQIPTFEMVSERRGRRVARPRQIAMFLARDLTPKSLPDIGRRFGGRDHTTVIHGIRTVERMIEEDVAFAREVLSLKSALSAYNVDNSQKVSFVAESAGA